MGRPERQATSWREQGLYQEEWSQTTPLESPVR